MSTPNQPMTREHRLDEADELYKSLLDFDADPHAAMENYSKLSAVRELLVQKFTVRLHELCGPRLAALRQVQTDVPPEMEIVDKYIIQLSFPFHRLIGSTPDHAVADAIEERMRTWMGDANFDAIMRELNDQIVDMAGEFSQWPIDRIKNETTDARNKLNELLNP